VIGTRLLRLFLTLLAVTFLTFSMLSFLPSDPVNSILGTGPRDPQVEAQLREDLGLDDPFLVRYWNWLGDAVQGDLGESYINRGTQVSTIIGNRLPVTAQLAVMAIVIALILAVPIGVIGAYKQGKWPDTVSSAGVQVALSVPNFIVGIFLIWLFAVQLQWLPSSNWNRLSDGLGDNLRTAILPASALAMTQMAIFSRLVRADMVATLKENYILAARAKGLSDRFILFRHALRPTQVRTYLRALFDENNLCFRRHTLVRDEKQHVMSRRRDVGVVRRGHVQPVGVDSRIIRQRHEACILI
jgi:peptide/nickel transport system permease protein